MLGWAIFYQPAIPSKPLFFAERIWFMTWMLCQSLSFFVVLVAALFACGKPRLLLSARWQRSVFHIHNTLLLTQFAIFLTVVLVDFFESFLILTKHLQLFHAEGRFGEVTIKYYRERPEAQELLLNTIVRVSQLISGFVLLGTFLIYLEDRSRLRKKRSKAEGLIKQLKQLKEMKWSENQTAGDELVSEQYDCAFCINTFDLNDSVVQLKCHRNHIFHRSCFSTYLEHMREEGVGQPKCPFCKVAIEF